MQLMIYFILLLLLALGVVLYPLRSHRVLMLCLTPVLVFFVSIGYWQWGSWQTLEAYQQKLRQQAQAKAMLKHFNGMDALIAQLKKRLQDNPNSAHGWYLLGRLYAGQSQWKLAHRAFKNALKLKPEDEATIINLVQSNMWLHQGHINENNKTLLEKLVLKNPQHADALAILAMDAYSNKAYEQAIQYWQRILPQVDPRSEAGEALRKAIAKAQTHVIH